MVEAGEFGGEGVGLGVLQAEEEDLEDGGKEGLQGFFGKGRDDAFEKLETIDLIGFGGHELLENSQDGFQLAGLGDSRSSSGYDGREKTDESGDVAFHGVQLRTYDGTYQSLVVFRQSSGRVGFKERGKKLEYIGHKFYEHHQLAANLDLVWRMVTLDVILKNAPKWRIEVVLKFLGLLRSREPTTFI